MGSPRRKRGRRQAASAAVTFKLRHYLRLPQEQPAFIDALIRVAAGNSSATGPSRLLGGSAVSRGKRLKVSWAEPETERRRPTRPAARATPTQRRSPRR